MGATGLVKKSKIAAAQSLTKASPISGITDNALWLESSGESSFKDTESSTGDSVTTWYDQKNSINKSSVVAVGTGPTYSNTINYIHAVKFSGSTANYLQVSDASFLNNTDYTIIVLEKRQSSTAIYFRWLRSCDCSLLDFYFGIVKRKKRERLFKSLSLFSFKN
jgi:hypothetical protein